MQAAKSPNLLSGDPWPKSLLECIISHTLPSAHVQRAVSVEVSVF